MKKKIGINNILIIENDPSLIDIFRSIFSADKNNFIVDIIEEADSAFNLLKEKHYNCIILDYSIDNYNDFNFLYKLEKQGILAPVIIISNIEDEVIAVSSLREGSYDYIPKKYIKDDNFKNILLDSVKNAVNHHRIMLRSRNTIQSLEMREERYRTIVENSPILILRFSPEDKMISFVNDGFCNYFSTNRYDVLGENFYNIIPDELTERITNVIGSMNSGNQISTFENYSSIEGERKWQLWTTQVLCGENGSVLEYQCMGEDITELKLAQIELQNQKMYLQSILDSQDNMIVVTKKDEIILANISFLNFFGYKTFNDLKKKYMTVINLAINIDDYKIEMSNSEWIENVLKGNEKHNLIAFKPDYLEAPRIFSAFVSRLLSDDERYVVSFTDVTELEMKSKKFEQKASYDMLTNIYNRQKFEELFIKEVMKSKCGSVLSTIFFDIDFFKKINDTYGHDVGDSVLRDLSFCIKNCIRNSDIFARWGGEEFIILLPGVNLETAMDIAKKLRKKVKTSKFKSINNITCSFGVTQAKASDTIDSILKRADKALYIAKETGRDKVAVINYKS